MAKKKGISTIFATVLLILMVISAVMIMMMLYNKFSSIISKDQCYQSYAENFCVKNNLTLGSLDRKAGYFTCLIDKEKKEIKTFYVKGICK